MNRRRLVRAPASSANLGPGFDTFAAALQRCNVVDDDDTDVVTE